MDCWAVLHPPPHLCAPFPYSMQLVLTAPDTLQIDVLLVDGVYYGFSGCHRFEAHQRLGRETIRCRVRRANQQVLKMHMM